MRPPLLPPVLTWLPLWILICMYLMPLVYCTRCYIQPLPDKRFSVEVLFYPAIASDGQMLGIVFENDCFRNHFHFWLAVLVGVLVAVLVGVLVAVLVAVLDFFFYTTINIISIC